MVGFAPSNVEPTLGVKFISAGLAASIADCMTFPLDMAKVRLQLQGEGSTKISHRKAGQKASVEAFKYRGIFGTIRTIAREEGVRSLYNGLVPGLQRQMAFASIRIGLYDSVKSSYQKALRKDQNSQSVGIRILAGITTGGMAVFCAQPTDVVKVRMQAQTAKTGRRYNGSMHAYRTIAAQEGMRGLWKGTLPNVTRNAVVNASELVSYDLIKQQILSHQLMSDNMPCHFVSAFGAGFCTTVVASPVDVVKTRYMNSRPDQYTGAINCAIKMFREGGFFAFYKGFMPSFVRLGSWNIGMFVCFEQLKRAFMYYKTTAPMQIQNS